MQVSIYCVLSARHVSGLHAHLQDQWTLNLYTMYTMYTIYISYSVSNHSHRIPIWLNIQYTPLLPPLHKTLIPALYNTPTHLQNTHSHSTHTHILHTPQMGYTLSIPTKIHIELYKYCFSSLHLPIILSLIHSYNLLTRHHMLYM